MQFEHINNEANKAVSEGNPVLSIDAKKKENIGNFKNYDNIGRRLQRNEGNV
ncbi:MAG: hypothetical protein LBH05_00825 [Deferribacteraceae bacterium]|nr:hypothetical protein [Deferribacteraceae bacterium]